MQSVYGFPAASPFGGLIRVMRAGSHLRLVRANCVRNQWLVLAGSTLSEQAPRRTSLVVVVNRTIFPL